MRKRGIPSMPAGIDIGTSGIKLVQLAPPGPQQGLEIIRLDQVQYREIDQRLEANARKIELLKMLVERNKIGPEVVSSLSINELQFYNLSLPSMSRQELHEAVRWKIEQLLPSHMQMKEAEFDFLILNEEESFGATGQVKILAVVAAKAVIEERVKLLQKVGLEPVAIEVDPFALVGFSPEIFRDDKEVILWLDLGAEATSMVVTKGAKVYFCRSLAVNSNQLTKAILEHRRVEWNKAEELKTKHGLSKDETTSLYLSMASTLENLIVDIEHSFKYFSYQITQSQVTKFDRVILAGGGADLKNLPQFLSEKLGAPVELANPFSGLKISEEIRSQKGKFLQAPSGFALACGLAGRLARPPKGAGGPVDKEGVRPNLMPKKEVVNTFQKKGMRIRIGIACAFLLIVGLQLGRTELYRWRVNSARRQVQLAKSELKRLQSQQFKLAEEEAEFLDRKLKIEARLNLLKESRHYPEEFSKVLAEVATLVPEEAWLKKLSYSDRKFSIIGSTFNMQLVVGLIEKLEASETFLNPAFNYTQKEPREEGVYNFEITAEIK